MSLFVIDPKIYNDNKMTRYIIYMCACVCEIAAWHLFFITQLNDFPWHFAKRLLRILCYFDSGTDVGYVEIFNFARKMKCLSAIPMSEYQGSDTDT